MDFDEKYPHAIFLEEPETDIIKGERKWSCSNCKKPTNWIEINFMTHLCSEECVKAKWIEFEESFGYYRDVDGDFTHYPAKSIMQTQPAQDRTNRR